MTSEAALPSDLNRCRSPSMISRSPSTPIGATFLSRVLAASEGGFPDHGIPDSAYLTFFDLELVNDRDHK
jgi:hypothetical protein